MLTTRGSAWPSLTSSPRLSALVEETRARLLQSTPQPELAADRVAFARAAGIEPDPWQVRLLHSTAVRLILSVTRQGGKSTAAAVLAVHCTLFEPGALVLLVSPTLRQSGELFKKCLSVYRALGRPVPAESETALTLTLENGSRIVSLPGSEASVRGFSAPRLIIEDEAARVPDDLHLAILPMLATGGGRVIQMSTPWGTRGHFYETWAHGGPTWERYEVPATQVAHISPERLDEMRREMGEYWYRQEFLVEFMDAQSAAFRSEDIARAFAEEIEVWNLS